MASKSKAGAPAAAKSTAKKSDSAPAKMPAGGNGDPAVNQARAVQAMVAAMPQAEHKLQECGHENAVHPPEGTHVAPGDPSDTASSLAEKKESAKVGTAAQLGHNATNGSLDRVRADDGGQALTTNQGVHVAHNQHSLKAGLRGPALLEDFILREKITHFDHERIPERIVHARGTAAHGYFECYEALTDLTAAAPFKQKGKITPLFTRRVGVPQLASIDF